MGALDESDTKNAYFTRTGRLAGWSMAADPVGGWLYRELQIGGAAKGNS